MSRFFAMTKRVKEAGKSEPFTDKDIRITGVVFQACGGDGKDKGRNKGKVYVGDDSMDGMENGDGSIQIAPPPAGVTPDLIPYARSDGSNTISLSEVWVKADHPGDGLTAICEER